MVTIETAVTPLDIAYCSVKFLSSYHIYLLREVALQYAAHGTTVDTARAVTILSEVRLEQRRGLREYENMVVYPRLATDFHAVGRHDIALDIIEETIRHSRLLRVRWEASIYAYVASTCNDIGEHERCDLLLRKVAEYVEAVPRFGASDIENYWVYDLFLLYLRLGMLDSAESLATKMSGKQQVNALATLAPKKQPEGKCQGSSLYMVKCMLLRVDAPDALVLLDRLLAIPHAVSIDSDHLDHICDLLGDDHADMLHKVLGHVSSAVIMNTRKLTRLAGMATLVGFLAPYSRRSAEAAVDQLFDSCTSGLDQGEHNITNRVPVALHTLAIAIDKHGLGWSDSRREMFRQILGRIPVPRRFEYVDLFRSKIVVTSDGNYQNLMDMCKEPTWR